MKRSILRLHCSEALHFSLVGLGGFEPPTSPLSGVRSDQLSYRPFLGINLVSRKQFVWALTSRCDYIFNKEVIQPQVPLRLPCYDLAPVMYHTVVSDLPKVSLPASGTTHFHGLTGGVYKARERIHRNMLICDY
jgi:hypothetical protein